MNLSIAERDMIESHVQAFLAAAAEAPPGTEFDLNLFVPSEGLSSDVRRYLFRELLREDIERKSQAFREGMASNYQETYREFGAQVETVLREVRAELAGEPDGESSALPATHKWELLRKLDKGDGRSSEVFLGKHRRHGHLAAVKVLRRDERGNLPEAAVLRFQRETRIQAGFLGSGAPTYFDDGYTRCGRPYIAMELVEGETFQSILPTVPTPFASSEASVRLIADFCRALAPIHEGGTGHFDLSPANVMRTRAGLVKVLDFEFARDASDPQEPTGFIAGTLDYMAPEKGRGEVELFGLRTDVYSIGAFLAQAISGHPPLGGPRTDVFSSAFMAQVISGHSPFGGETLLAPEEKLRRLRDRDLSEDIERVRQVAAGLQVPMELIDLTMECLSMDSTNRPADAGTIGRRIDVCFAAAAERARQSELIEAKRKKDEERRNSQRRASQRLAVALAVTFAFAGVAIYYLARLTAVKQTAQNGEIAEKARQWPSARVYYSDAARSTLLSDFRRSELHLKEARAAMFQNALPAADALLDKIENSDSAGRLQSRIDFERAVYELNLGMRLAAEDDEKLAGDFNPHEREAIRRLHQAMARGLGPADAWTARGLLAETAPEAMAAYREALRIEPHHPYASAYHLVACLLAGRFDEALALVQVWATAAPDDPLPWFYKAAALTMLQRDAEAAVALLELHRADMAGRAMTPETTAACESFVRFMRVFGQELPNIAADESQMPAATGRLLQALPTGLAGLRTVLFVIPLAPHQRIAVGRFVAALRTGLFASGDAESALRTMGETKGFIAEGMVRFAQGMLRTRLFKKNGFKLQDMTRAVEDFKASADLPAYWDVRTICWLSAANFDLTASQLPQFREQAGKLQSEAKVYLTRAAAIKMLSPPVRRKTLEIAGKTQDPSFVRNLEALIVSGAK